MKLEPIEQNIEAKERAGRKSKEEMLQEQLVYAQRLANDLFMKLERTQS
ncbi:hypothetical protein CHCC14809_3641 [Bacillus licheniformis]|jgi:hypothetical protein|nr:MULTISPECIES: hypothetical protein [Bacillus]EQM28557.1 hypothetical protein N399_08215 [Bacillus licheniformis CG-B52]MCM3377513.1 hypothetical protein [Bacillus licheniformis]MCM3465548.1 hypothetical protein [Bacillus licheniformis]MCU9958754.1 hypothetical protein [Bacillus licheniformis]MCY8531011.1 hypothetical protein [Bacillus licheniformis]